MTNWAFVTGGAGDIGSAVCQALARDGFGIVCVDLDEERAEKTCSGIRMEGGQAVSFKVDATDPASVSAAAAAAMKIGNITTLVNTVGRAKGASIFTMDYAVWREDIAANLDSAFLCIQAFRDQLIAQQGSIVSIATVNGLGVFGFPGYSAGKAGLIHLTKCLAVELGPHGVRVNAVAPGTVRTRAWNARLEANPGVFDELQALCPLPRISAPANVADAVAFSSPRRRR